MTVIQKNLLVDLDSIFDVRSGVLTSMNAEKSATLLHDEMYARRYIDEFPGIDVEEFKKRYAERTIKDITNTMVTPVVAIVHDYVARSYTRQLGAPQRSFTEVYVNTYPYVVDDAFKYNVGLALASRMRNIPKFIFIHKSPEELTPGYLRARVDTVVMYDFIEWIEIHGKNRNIEKTPIPGVTLIAPMLVKKMDAQFPEDPRTAFMNQMVIYQLHLNLLYMPVEVFSSVLAKRVPSTDPKASAEHFVEPDDEGDDVGI